MTKRSIQIVRASAAVLLLASLAVVAEASARPRPGTPRKRGFNLLASAELPINVNPIDNDLDDPEERDRLRRVFSRGLGTPTGFVLPLSVTMFKIAAPVSWTIGALFVGWFYGIPLSLGDLAIVAFASTFLAFAAPGVPRGAFLMLTPLFLAIGLPAEGIGILIAVDAIPDLFSTVLNVTGYLASTAIVARRSSGDE